MNRNIKKKKPIRKKSKRNKRKILIRNSLILLVIIIGAIILFVGKKETPEESMFKDYFAKLQEKNYEAMYEMLTKNKKSNISKEDFVLKNQNIYEGIGLSNIEIVTKEIKQEKAKTVIEYEAKWETLAGEIEFDNTMTFVKEDENYKIVWTSKDIYPKLATNDKVKVTITRGYERQYL